MNSTRKSPKYNSNITTGKAESFQRNLFRETEDRRQSLHAYGNQSDHKNNDESEPSSKIDYKKLDPNSSSNQISRNSYSNKFVTELQQQKSSNLTNDGKSEPICSEMET